jgi:enoyl-CoA hydratase/carnithine racemase
MSANASINWPVSLPGCLRVRQEGSVALVGLSRPEKRNSLSDELVLGLQSFYSTLPADITAVVMYGEGDDFCAGLDLNELKEGDLRDSLQTSIIGQRLNDTIQYLSVPVIAVLAGAVIGGGLELAAAAHLRVAEPSTYFALPEGVRGIFLGSGGSVRLPRLLGTARVMDMMLTGRSFNAEDGYSFGVFQYLVGANEGLAKGLELANAVSGNAFLSNYAILQGLPRIVEESPQNGLFTEAILATLAQGDEEARRRLRDFLERRANKVVRPDTAK